MEGLKMKYFVLNPSKDDAYGRASRAAIREYARRIYEENSALTSDLHTWVDQEESRISREVSAE